MGSGAEVTCLILYREAYSLLAVAENDGLGGVGILDPEVVVVEYLIEEVCVEAVVEAVAGAKKAVEGIISL